jgi:ADP-ribose pyrophosphatase
MKKYEEQHVTVDIVISAYNFPYPLKVLLIKRKNEPFKDQLAIPGGYLNANETLEDAAYRELEEETSLSKANLKTLKKSGGRAAIGQFHTYGDPGRDPRGRIISVVYTFLVPYNEKLISMVKASDDAKEAKWFELDHLPDIMAFDHAKILRDIKTDLEKTSEPSKN